MRTTILKKAARCLMAAVFALSSSSLLAEETEYTPLSGAYDFLAVKNISLKTTHFFDYGNPEDWTGEGFHTGIQTFGVTIFNCKDIPKDFVSPENPTFFCEIKDFEGNVIGRQEIDLTQMFRKLKYAKNFTENKFVNMGIVRGGKYTLTAGISSDLFSYGMDMTLPSAPDVQIFKKSVTVDEPLSPMVIFSSGYPYEPEKFAGKKNFHWQVAPEKSPSDIIAEKSEVFELLSKTPMLAAVDTLHLNVGNLEPGEYRYTFTSDFEPANYSFIAKVNDVLIPEITLDKSSYSVGESKEAVIKLAMNYSYPYVGRGTSSSTPTVEVIAELLNEKINATYSDDAWADSDMHCDAELKIPLDIVTEEIVKENKGQVPLNIKVTFNGNSEFEQTITIPFEYESTGIGDIKADCHNKSGVKYYNIFGVEVDANYRGLVITSDGHKMIR